MPSTPAVTSVLSSSTWACARAASALAFCAGNAEAMRVCCVALLASAASSEPWRPSTTTCSRSISRMATVSGLRRRSSVRTSSSSCACASAAPRLGNLAVGSGELALGDHRIRLDLGDPPPGGLYRRLLLAVVEPEQRLAGFDPLVDVHVDFRDPAERIRAGW